MSSISTIMATHFRREDVLCMICHSPLPTGTHRRLLKPPSSLNESASSFFGCLRKPILVEGECIKLCSAKLDNIVPMAHGKTIHAVQQVVSDLCSCCMFL